MPDRTLSPEDRRAWQLAREQEPGGYPADAEMRPWEPSPLQQQKYELQDMMGGIGSLAAEHNIPFLRALDDPQYRKGVAEELTFLSEFVPGFGDIQGAREGAHMIEEGSPKMGAAVMALSALPLVTSGAARRVAGQVFKRTPTQVERTVTGYGTPDSPLGTQLSRTNYETLAERSILAKYTNPNKAYNVADLINNTTGSVPDVIQGTLRRQLNDYIGPELRRGEATIQEILDDIGKNKPRVVEQVSEDIMPARAIDAETETQGRGARYLPNIPTEGPALSGPEATQTLMPLRYTERNLSTHVPGEPPLHSRAGHTEVGQGERPPYRTPIFGDRLGEDVPFWDQNIENRLFHTRSGIYEIEGKKVFIPAEGQSGVYGMGTSRTQAGESLGELPFNVEQDIFYGLRKDLIDFGIWRKHEVPMADMVDKIAPYLKPGYSKDDWLSLAARQQDEIAAARQSGLRRYGITEEEYLKHIDSDYTPDRSPGFIQREAHGGVEDRVFEARKHFELVTTDNVSKYEPLFNKMIGGSAVEPPFFDEWFPLHMKTSLNDAVEQGADSVRFPINDYAVAKQTGQPLQPHRAREFSEEFTATPAEREYLEDPNWTQWEEMTERLEKNFNWQPSEDAQALAIHYRKRTDNGLARIEAEYGVKLNPRRVRDDNNNVFLEIDLTPELKEAFKIVIFNRGGAVHAPLMPLKYSG